MNLSLIPEVSAKDLARMSAADRLEFQVHRNTAIANAVDREMVRNEEPTPVFRGQPRTVCSLGEEDLQGSLGLNTLLANMAPGRKNLANGFASADNDQARRLANQVMGLANDDRFTASYFSTPLTAYTVGWTDPEDLESLVNFVAPKVNTNRRFEYKLAINKEAFYSEVDDERAIGSDFKRVEYKGASNYAKTINRGLKYRIDLDEEGAGIINEQLIVGRLLQRVRRNQWRRASAAATALGVLNNTNKTWTNSGQTPAPQPIEDVRQILLQQVQAVSGVFPNRILMDLKSWNLIKASYAPQLTAGAIAMYNMTVDDLVADLMIDSAMVAKAIYTSAAGTQANTTGTKSYVWPQAAIGFYGQDNPGLDDPSNFKRFVTPAGDGDFRVFRQQVGAKFVDISVEYYDNILTTATVGLGQITPS